MSLRVDSGWVDQADEELPWYQPPRPEPPSPETDWVHLARRHAADAGAGAAAGALAVAALALGMVLLAAAVATAAVAAALWSALAVAGLGLSICLCTVALATHAATVAWHRSRPHRDAAGRATRALGPKLVERTSQAQQALTRHAAQAGTALAQRRRAARTLRQAAPFAVPSIPTTGPAPAEPARPTRPEPLGPTLRRLVTGVAAAGAVLAAATFVLALPVRMAVGLVRGGAVVRAAAVRLPALAQGSTVYAANGQVVAVLHGNDNRQPVSLSAVSPLLVNAVVDTEDTRFWKHGGVDGRAMVRAAFTDLSGGGRQGGSTIAEQLVKNTVLASSRDDLVRKVKEAVLADRLEAKVGRRAVLQAYLNTVYLGESAYGVEAGAETYFGRAASELDPAQAALLAGLIQDPTGYDPLAHPAEAAERRAVVLGLMVAAHHLSPAVSRAARAEALPTTVHLPPPGRNYFTDAVKADLLADPRLGPTPAARYHALFYGGLKIHTTLAPAMEANAQKAVSAGLPASPPGMTLSGALAAVNPATGAVPAVVGGPNFHSSQYDVAIDRPGRQTGSAFKVFTLVAALEEGYSPHDVIDGAGPCTIPDPGGTPDPWVLSNYEGESFGNIDLTTATAKSVNCAYARLALMVGLPRIARVAHQMGVTVPLAVVPSMTLGTNDVPPLQLATAYATLADGGVYHRPYVVASVVGPDGRTVLRNTSPGTPVMSRQVAAEAVSVLTQVVVRGTGTAAALPGREVAGKTGTTASFQDAWFVGMTPQLVAAVWMGDPAREVPMIDVGGVAGVAGGTFPAEMWRSFMSRALAGRPALRFPGPDPALVPGATYLQLGQPRTPTTGGGAAGAHTNTTTWCFSSCGKAGPPPPNAPHQGKRK